jgi:hypothetical protein
VLIAPPGGTTAERWRESLGPRWRLHLGAFALLLFAIGAVTTLNDPDLPLHLLTGEWIVHHHAVPFVEPFAWTRVGAPYFAYSWLSELLYFGLDVAFGPLGLRLLFGACVALTGLTIVRMGNAAGWRPWTSLLTGLLQVSFAIITVPGLRPQFALYILLPMLWEAAFRLSSGEGPRRPLTLAFIASVLAANSHILFPSALAPAAVLLARRVRPRIRLWQFAGVVMAGWLVSPYALVWPAVFRLNFAPNLLFGRFSPIVEHWPGFNWLLEARSPFALIVLLLAVLPWLFVTIRLEARERLVYGGLWLGGLLLFGSAIRGVEVWWLVSLPLIGRVIEQLADPPAPRLGTARIAALYLFGVSRALVTLPVAVRDHPKEGDTVSRTFASLAANEVEPISRWLDCHLAPLAAGRGRLFTTFNEGSYLAWRLPMLSASIDGRTIFPDSVAASDAFQLASHGAMKIGAWHDADLAIVQLSHATAEVLDTAAGWRRVAVTDSSAPNDAPPAGLWVTGRWWRTAERGALPPLPLHLPRWTGRDGAPTCDAK